MYRVSPRVSPNLKGNIMAINLSDFKKTKYSGVYKSIEADAQKGYKYLLRYKYENKTYKRILGYSKRDNFTYKNPLVLLDNIPVSDIEKLLLIDPSLIKTIDVYNHQYVYFLLIK